MKRDIIKKTVTKYGTTEGFDKDGILRFHMDSKGKVRVFDKDTILIFGPRLTDGKELSKYGIYLLGKSQE